MGSCQPFVDDEPFDKRVKTLADNELLEIWEETQQLEDLLRTQMQTDLDMAPEYERLIVSELQLRSNRPCCTSASGAFLKAEPLAAAGALRPDRHGLRPAPGRAAPGESTIPRSPLSSDASCQAGPRKGTGIFLSGRLRPGKEAPAHASFRGGISTAEERSLPARRPSPTRGDAPEQAPCRGRIACIRAPRKARAPAPRVTPPHHVIRLHCAVPRRHTGRHGLPARPFRFPCTGPQAHATDNAPGRSISPKIRSRLAAQGRPLAGKLPACRRQLQHCLGAALPSPAPASTDT